MQNEVVETLLTDISMVYGENIDPLLSSFEELSPLTKKPQKDSDFDTYLLLVARQRAYFLELYSLLYRYVDKNWRFIKYPAEHINKAGEILKDPETLKNIFFL